MKLHIDSPTEQPRSTIFNVRGWVAAERQINEIRVNGNVAALEQRPDVIAARPKDKYVTGFIVKADETSIVDGKIDVEVNDNVHQHPLKPNTMLDRSKREKFEKYGQLFPDDNAAEMMLASRECEVSNNFDKTEAILPLLSSTNWHDRDGVFDFLSDELRGKYDIVDNPVAATRAQDPLALALIGKFKNGLVLDCGSGFPLQNYSNVVNFEIQNYPNTDVIGIGEKLPFKDKSFDVAFSFSVLEHVKDPFLSALELKRVLKPNGVLYVSVPFLQPIHAYPHHYYNMTEKGLKNLFSGINIIADGVPISGHPVFTLSWVARSWLLGLEPAEQEQFNNLTIREIASNPEALINARFCTELNPEVVEEIACTNMILGTKAV